MHNLRQERILSCLRLICSLLAEKWIQRTCKRSSQNVEKSTELELVAHMILGFVCPSFFEFVNVDKVTLLGPSSTERCKQSRTPSYTCLRFALWSRPKACMKSDWLVTISRGPRKLGETREEPAFPLPAVLCAQIYSWERGLETGQFLHGHQTG